MTSLCGNWTAPPLPGCYVELACVLSSSSVGYITILLSIYLRCSTRGKRKERWNLFTGHTIRCILSIVLFLLHLSEVGELATGGRSWILTVASMFSWTGLQFFYATTEKFGRVQYLAATSILYLTVGLSRSVLLYTLLERIDMTYVATVLAALTSTVSYACALNDFVTLIKEIKLDRDERKAPSKDYESYCHNRAHWFSRVTFFWLTPLLRMGFDNPLELEDLGRLPWQESTSEQFNKFQQNYLKLKGSDGVASLWKCFARSYWRNFAVGGILKLVGDSVGLVAPLGISIVIDYVEFNGPTSDTGQDSFVTLKNFFSNGYVMTVIIFISTIAQGSFSQASTHVINVEGIRLKTALQGMIYAKTLKLSVCSNDDDSFSSDKVGNASNLMSEDTFNIMTCLWIGHYTWAIPLKISALMYLTYCKLGISAIVGASCCIVIMTPMQFWIGKKMSDNTKIIASLDDERLRLTNEMLQGIKLLKLCGWEEVFRRRLMVSREKELKFLDKDSLYWALMTFLTHSSSSVITLITLGAFYYLGGSHLTAANVFSALALFNQLTVPLFIFPITVPIIISALVSTRRIEDYLAMPEATSYFHQDDPEVTIAKISPFYSQDKLVGGGGLRDIMEETESYGDFDEDRQEFAYSRTRASNACVLREASFSWGDSDKPSLFISCLNIPKGELTAVIGKVGSGKTSFLNALLGEMKCTKGLMKWEKGTTFAYVSQQPWLLNATIRENILMGLSYKAKRFAKVISATALQQDIELMPNRDLTELSDKGVNLSGGQRQRIAIARALYSRANVIILDDPLSALDYHVSQHVFEEGIINLSIKHKKTVVLVTHSLHLLTYAHKVVALEHGRIRACGKLRDMELIDGVVTGIDPGLDTRGRTARERWQLVKLVSRIGHHIRQQNIKLQNKQLFIPFRKRMSITSEYYWMQDLPLPSAPEDETDDSAGLAATRGSSTLPRHRPVARASSLQPHSSSGGPMNPVTRQASSPTINQGSRPRTYAFDAQNCGTGGGQLFRNIFTSNKSIPASAEVPQTGSFKDKSMLRRLMSSASFKSIIFSEHEKHAIRRLPSTCSDYSDECHADEDENLDPDWCGTSTLDEREYGTISTQVYWTYLKSCGVVISTVYIILAVLWQATRVYTDFWLTNWTHESGQHSHSQGLFYLTIYAVLSLVCVLISLLSNLFGQWAGARARKRLHNELVFTVLRLPIKIFEVTPLGRILARFSTDINVLDKKLATSVQRLMQFLLLCFSAILVNSIVTPWFLILAVPICLMYYIVQKFYRCSSRELQRLDSMSRTPIISHLTETLSGLETIRGFRQQKRFTSAMFCKLDSHTNAFLIANSAARWLGIALDYLGAFIVLLAMLVCIFCSRMMPEVVTAALVGLAINYTLLVPIYLNWVVKFLSDVEMYMASVERICHYIKMTPENYKIRGVVPRVWPSKGEIRFESVSLRYDQSAEMAISNINLVIPAGQKVGICGRTGSGKSSLVMSLFGMTPVTDGHIYIDGVNISAVPLKTLRTRLSVIPQDIIMFSGTIRENLDMENRFTDAELWAALSLAQMKDVVITQLGGLNGQVREGGVNLSMGQHQLLCLARAILHKTVCLIMDEATSSLDVATEKTLLLAAEKSFANKTVITIAHRLTSLLSCDRILVLESGRIVEDGSPNELLNRSMGIFSTMLRTSEERRMQ